MKNTEKPRVFIDSKSFAELLEQDNWIAKAILRYHDSDLLDLVRYPLETASEELRNVVEYEPLLDGDSKLTSIKVTKDKSEQTMSVRYRKEDILSIAQEIYGKKEINADELENITQVFIQAVFNMFEKSNIYVTNNEVLLKKRLWFESHFPGGPLNIMTIEEAALFLDLFLKKKGKYFVSSRYSLNKGFWYLLSMRLKLPHYNVGDPIINALSNRFNYVLMALDEMGMQYYLGPNNDTMDNTIYHFNYWISLVTGIFDNLALKTDAALGINSPSQIRISLHNTSGRDFLKKIREKNAAIRAHINSYVEFINLIYLFRDRVIHREGLPRTGFENRDRDGLWKANFIKVTEEIKQKLRACGDQNSQFDPFTIWGLYEMHSEYFLDPYNFSLNATRKLTEFVDKYLELLEYPSFVEAQKQRNDDFTKTLFAFEKYHLGF